MDINVINQAIAMGLPYVNLSDTHNNGKTAAILQAILDNPDKKILVVTNIMGEARKYEGHKNCHTITLNGQTPLDRIRGVRWDITIIDNYHMMLRDLKVRENLYYLLSYSQSHKSASRIITLG